MKKHRETETLNYCPVYSKSQFEVVFEKPDGFIPLFHLILPTPFEYVEIKDQKEIPPISNFYFKERIKERTVARNQAIEKGISEVKPASYLGDLGKRTLIKKPVAMRCTYPWDFVSLKGNGAAQLCCGAVGYEDGNLLESGFWNIWNGPVRRYLRRTVNSDHVDIICNACPLNKVRDIDSADTHVLPDVRVDNLIAQTGSETSDN